MRTVAGHPLEGTYFNPRDTVKPPATLKKRVFPEVEEGLANIRKDPSNLEERLSEVGFLRLMDFLRTVFLQDAALLRRSYPDHEIFKDGLFGTDEFKAFAATVCQAEDNPDWPENKNIQAVVPEISAMMAGMRQESSIGHSRTHSRIDEVAKDLKRVRRDVQLQSETLRAIGGPSAQFGDPSASRWRSNSDPCSADSRCAGPDSLAARRPDPRGPCRPGLRVPDRSDRCGIQRCRR